MNTKHLFGPAGRLANLFARTLEDSAEPVKLLFTGEPGCGKTSLANQIAATLCGSSYAIESVNGRKCSIHVVSEWQRSTASTCMFGTGNRAFVINEVDTCPADSQDLLLTFLDEMPDNCAFIGTSNLDLSALSERFRTRLQRHEVAAPEPEEIAAHLCEAFGAPEMIAQQIAFLCGGNVRAAELDARAWANEHAPKARRARVIQPGFDLISAEGA